MTAQSSRPPAANARGEDRPPVEALFGALEDSDCRAILRVVGTEPLTAQEIADACEIPISTVYRKVDTLTDAGLLEPRTRVRDDGKHPQQYTAGIEEIHVDLGDNGVAVDCEGEGV
ncbi:ArsR family transcriptional regulator [Halorhabdus sp. CBA1104]|uniref:winged helix-turn-helix domain-containing protein n=1 Tax=unclassified Halorhabdus TaxID=2621901 RepID=UPI0012B20673|nr:MULTISPECIES: helix-turn-helix domain-containing protein [unclassified Halorhabdus]QGN06975.1 ArsR family transcriptional regulator [Halorhabdus sp. CBA1104]